MERSWKKGVSINYSENAEKKYADFFQVTFLYPRLEKKKINKSLRTQNFPPPPPNPHPHPPPAPPPPLLFLSFLGMKTAATLTFIQEIPCLPQ